MTLCDSSLVPIFYQLSHSYAVSMGKWYLNVIIHRYDDSFWKKSYIVSMHGKHTIVHYSLWLNKNVTSPIFWMFHMSCHVWNDPGDVDQWICKIYWSKCGIEYLLQTLNIEII